MDLEGQKRQLSFSDIQKGNEFTIAQATSVLHAGYSRQTPVRVGDVMKIVKFNQKEVTVTFTGGTVEFAIPLDEIGDIIVAGE